MDRKAPAVEVTNLTVQEGHMSVTQATVENCVETRVWGHHCQHHVTHQPSGVARGHNVWYSKLEVRVSGLEGSSQRSNNGSPHVCSGQYR